MLRNGKREPVGSLFFSDFYFYFSRMNTYFGQGYVIAFAISCREKGLMRFEMHTLVIKLAQLSC